eukprot:2919895-Amphidinium_carterae.2
MGSRLNACIPVVCRDAYLSGVGQSEISVERAQTKSKRSPCSTLWLPNLLATIAKTTRGYRRRELRH